jgi:hypothetical protein
MGTTEQSRVRDYVDEAVRQFRESLTAVATEHERAGLEVRQVLGEPDDFADRAVQAAAPLSSPWDELVGPFVRSDGVQARLGISRQAVAAKAARRRLLRVITTDDVHLYPVWQFAGSAMLPGLADVLALFPEDAVDGWTLAGWLRTPDAELAETPCDVLARGDVARVLAVARGVAGSLAT